MTFLQQIRLHRVRFLKTIGLLSCYMNLSMVGGIVGPALLDLRQQVQTDMTTISFCLTARAAGHAIGSLLMGFSYDRVNFLLATSICMMYSAVFTLIIPFIRVTWLLLSVFVIDQLALGAYEVGSNMFILHLWGREATPFMQCLQSMFGFGALIVPVIAVPFLVETDSDDDKISRYSFNNATNGTREEEGREIFHPERIQLIWPYTIVSVYLVINSIYMFACWRLYPETKAHPSRDHHDGDDDDGKDGGHTNQVAQQSDAGSVNRSEESDHRGQDDEEPLIPVLDCCSSVSCDTSVTVEGTVPATAAATTEEDPIHRSWRIVTVILTLIFMHVYLGLEITFGSFLTAFAVKCDLRLSKATGALLTTVYWTSFTLFRLLTILYMDWTGIGVNIGISIVIVLISNAFLLPHGSDNVTMLWTGVILIGIGTSSIFGCMFAYLEDFMIVTSMISALMIMSAVLGEFTFPVIISKFIDADARIFLYVTLSCSIGIAVLFALIAYVCRYKLGRRRKTS